MRKRTLRALSGLICLFFLASLFQAPLLADVSTIAVNVGGQTLNVTPGQWVSVKSATGTTHYNVRFVDGKPVALEMSQFTRLVFGDGAAAGTTAGQTGQVAQSNQPTQTSQTSQAAQTTKTGQAAQSSQSAQSGQSSQAGQVAQSNQSAQSGQSSQAGQVAQSNQSAQSGQSSQAGSNVGTVADGSSAANQSQTTTTPKKTTWDPAKHPRDPQTGRFISIEEAIERGIYEGGNTNSQTAQTGSSDASQAGQATGDASQAAQGSSDASQAGQATGDVVADGSQPAQTGSEGAAQGAGDKGSAKPGIGDKFKSGYQTGKALTNQGFQNVKDSLKSGFSAKNLLVTAGITVGVDLATQVMRGEKPSIKTALKTVCSAEFVGGVAGSVLGAATGSFFTPFLSAIPVVGGVLGALAPTFGSIIGSSMGAYLAGDLKNGRFSIKEAFKRIDWVGVTGQAIGSTAGAALGSFLGPVGTVIGGMVGGYLGNWAAQKIAGLFSKNKTADLPTVSMPVGAGTGDPVTVSSVTVGGENGTSDIPESSGSTTSQADINIPTDDSSSVSVSSEISANDAYAKYSALYNEYAKLVGEGKMQEAVVKAQEMNAAKALYDQLLAAGK
ncbi:MAG: hypothetical protein PHF29_04930 [Candidatus Riflebacteria bacterium]|nr:hypothetical protein [Candidatus Riflebacteria bacterium]